MMIRLNSTELMVAAYLGSGRNVYAMNRLTPGAGQRHADWAADIEGAAGELAVAKALGIFWLPQIGDYKAEGDVGPYQVRCNMSRRLDDTILRPGDKPDAVYIGVLSLLPDVDVMGWIWGRDGMSEQYLRDGAPGRPPCFFVPRAALRPLSELPTISELMREAAA